MILARSLAFAAVFYLWSLLCGLAMLPLLLAKDLQDAQPVYSIGFHAGDKRGKAVGSGRARQRDGSSSK